MNESWIEAAKGIPVWDGAMFGMRDNAPRRAEPIDVLYWALFVQDGGAYVDLSDPDTRGGYIRRLALAHGCPDYAAAYGVRFHPNGYFTHLTLTAGAETVPSSLWTKTIEIPSSAWAWDDDARIALCEAWPADKRITS